MAILDEFFGSLQARIQTTVNETEVRDRFCGEVYSFFSITFRLERGRNDARLNRVILEFKDKGLFRGRTSSAKFQEAYSQLTNKYIPQQSSAEGLPLHEYIGVAIDGDHYAFVFFEENGNHRHTELVQINLDGLPPLLEAFRSDVRRAFTPENLIEDFGAQAVVAKTVLQELWHHLDNCLVDETGSQKVQMLFQEWRKLFAQVTSLGYIGQTRIDDYLRFVGIPLPSTQLDYAKVLFVLNTYNALLFKLIAAEVVTTLRYDQYSGFASKAAGCSLSDLRGLLNNHIEHAEIFTANNIYNFIEGAFFSWYLENTPDSLLAALKQMLSRLGLYVFPTTTHSEIRDVLKTIYQNLVPEALRKNIGEFYTPEWLVDLVLDEAGYTGSSTSEKRLLDPCCGSGNFLIHAIARCKEAARQTNETENHILHRILRNIIGFDLNPLAVIAARLNYLLAIADIITPTDRIEIPVYLADAIYAPTREENGGAPIRIYKVGTVLGNIDLALPEALVGQQQDFSKILAVMERDVEIGASRESFIAHLRQEDRIRTILDDKPDWAHLIGTMFDKIQQMEQQNWNRIWCRIVRNYFASVSVGKVHIIAGNPPWIRWSELPEEYRERIKPTCEQYDIFSETSFFGGNELDISGIIAYAVTDRWLEEGGLLAFVITQVHFQAPSSQGFRSFQLPDQSPLGVSRVHDFTNVRPFPGLANKPAVFTWRRGTTTTYPVDYTVWAKKERGSIPEEAPLEEVYDLIEARDRKAIPLPPDNRWSILPPEYFDLADKLKGGSRAWRGRKGIMTDLNAAYFVELVGPGNSPDLVRIRTHPEIGRKAVPFLEWNIEAALVYPLLKGAKDFSAFSYTVSDLAAIVPNKVITSIPSEASFSNTYPEAYRYFQRVNSVMDVNGVPLLENRSTWRTRMKPQGAPFYAIYNVGSYTFAPFKVVWAEIASSIYAAVISEAALPFGLGTKPIVPDHKVYFAATDNEDKAHFLCALLNSEPIRVFVNSFTVKIQVGTIFRSLRLPPFDPTNTHHNNLVALSRQAHSSGINSEVQEQLDSEVWEILESIEPLKVANIKPTTSGQLSLPNFDT